MGNFRYNLKIWWISSKRYKQLFITQILAVVLIVVPSSATWSYYDGIKAENNPEINIISWYYFIVFSIILISIVIWNELKKINNNHVISYLISLFITIIELLISLLINVQFLLFLGIPTLGDEIMFNYEDKIIISLPIGLLIICSIVGFPILLGEITLSFTAKFQKQIQLIDKLREKRLKEDKILNKKQSKQNKEFAEMRKKFKSRNEERV